MYLDISSNQGVIDWKELSKYDDINGIILRATTRNGKLDTRPTENYESILHNMSDIDEISVYKFSYARDYVSAKVECMQCLKALQDAKINFDYFYLDLEGFDGRDYTRAESDAVIMAYVDFFATWFNKYSQLRLYFNYNYLKNIINPLWRDIPIWLARYNSEMGDTFGANVVLWQYTSLGQFDGIKTHVDISKEVKSV